MSIGGLLGAGGGEGFAAGWVVVAVPRDSTGFPSTSAVCRFLQLGDPRPAAAAVVRWSPGWHGIPVHLRCLRLEVAVVYFGAMKKFFLFVLVAVLVAWVAKKVREV